MERQLPETRPPTGVSAQKSQDFVDVVVVAVETEDKAAGVQKSSLVCFDGDTWSVTLGCAVRPRGESWTVVPRTPDDPTQEFCLALGIS